MEWMPTSWDNEQDCVILRYILHMACQFRPCLCVLISLRFVQYRVIITGIGVYHDDLKQVDIGLTGNFLCYAFGVAAPREEGNQNLSFSARHGLCSDTGHDTHACGCVSHQTNAEIKAPLVLLQCSTVSRAHILGEIVPSPATVNTQCPNFRSGRVGLFFGRICTVIIPHPSADIAVHIIKTVGIRIKAAYGQCFLPIFSGLYGQVSL